LRAEKKAKMKKPNSATLTLFAAHEKSVLFWLGRGNLACHELVKVSGLLHQTASATLTHLRNRGCVKDSGKRSLTPSRRPAIIWQLVPSYEAAQAKYLKQNNITRGKVAK
jgi:hypothetical protein